MSPGPPFSHLAVKYDGVITSSLVSLAQLQAAWPALPPVLLYLMESQATYPPARPGGAAGAAPELLGFALEEACSILAAKVPLPHLCIVVVSSDTLLSVSRLMMMMGERRPTSLACHSPS